MKGNSCAFFVRCVLAVSVLCSACPAQVKPRVAVFPFDDRTTADADMKIGTKVADLLISKLTANGAFTVFDRQYVDKILEENHRKYDPNYDSVGAAKAGLLGTVDLVVAGQIDAYNAIAKPTDTKAGRFATRHQVEGMVSLKVTARLISVEKGSIVAAPTAPSDQKLIFCTETILVGGYGTGACPPGFDPQLRKLVDEATEEVAKKLSDEISPIAARVQPVVSPILADSAHDPPKAAKGSLNAGCLGTSKGLAYIDKGAADGLKVGDKFVVLRTVDTGLKDAAGKPVIDHEPVCAAVVSRVEEKSAAGKCTPDSPPIKGTDAIPRKGDEVMLSLNSPTSSK